MDPLSISASTAGLLTLAGAVTSGVQSLVMSYKDANKDLIKLYLELGALTNSIELLKSALGTLATHPIPQTTEFDPLALCSKTLKELNDVVPKFEEQKSLSSPGFSHGSTQAKSSLRQKFSWIRQAGKIEVFLERLQNHKTTLTVYVSAHEINVLKKGLEKGDGILEKMKHIEEEISHKREDDELKSLRSYFAQIDPRKWLNEASGRRQNGTGLWFING